MRKKLPFVVVILGVCVLVICILFFGFLWLAPVSFPEEPLPWPGADRVWDSGLQFHEDSSGLDIHQNQMYVIDNSSSCLWVLNILPDGGLELLPEYVQGRQVFFPDGHTAPDAEGVTVDDAGFVYIASESGPEESEYSRNYILQTCPGESGDRLIAQRFWNLDQTLPQTPANKGIEGVEWVSNQYVKDCLWDQNTMTWYNPSVYPDAISSGVFFVALESNGYVYAYVLNNDGTSVRINAINSGLGCAMALDYHTDENTLWVVADDNAENQAAMLFFRRDTDPLICRVSPPEQLDRDQNYEGFALTPGPEETLQVYRICDGKERDPLFRGTLNKDYRKSLLQNIQWYHFIFRQ